MNYIVLDLEWNQCPAGKAKEEKSLPFEIIEIGAIRLDGSHQMKDRFHEVVRPQLYTSLHFKTREIVSLRASDFAGARTFPEVAADFFDWCRAGDGEPDYCTWGPSDLTELQRNLAWHGMESPFSFPLIYYDIQKIFSIVYEDRKSRRSLESAVDYLQLPKEVPFHSALSDAYYTSLIMQKLADDRVRANSSVDYYHLPQTKKEEIYLHYETYDKYISRPFPSRSQAMKNSAVTAIRCPVCGKMTQRRVKWFSGGGHNEYALSWCPEHGTIKGKIRLRRNADGTIYAVKTTRPVSEADAQQIYDKRAALREKRRQRRQ